MKSIIRGYGAVLGAVSLFVFLSFSFLPPVHAASGEDPYQEALLKAAHEKGLSGARYWDVLIHYKAGITGRRKSLIDDPGFFLSPEGKADPEAELQSTIKAFFREDPGDGTHPRCRFPGRYGWLREALPVDEARLPGVKCAELDEAIKRVDPQSAVLIFPAAYMNAPASMFGHTLIRVDGGLKSRLISYAANYSALVDDTNGLLYAFKGIFGYYRGYYTILPYYEKVKEYNDLEQRDMWEYQLSLKPEEVERMVLHLWELKDIYSYYYFFDENCSYNLLFLFEAARPSLNLSDRMKYWVIPVDTLRLIKESGIVSSSVYRPSKATRIHRIAADLGGRGRQEAVDIANQRIGAEEAGGRDNAQRIRILDLATELTQLRYGRGELKKDDYQRAFLATLRARSRLGSPDDSAYRIDAPPEPEAGHSSSRLTLSAGSGRGGLFQEARLRPAYHGLLDPDEGYQAGSQIIFGEAALRYLSNGEGLRLESLTFVDIASLAPRDEFFKPFSWKVRAGLYQKTLADGGDHLILGINPGGGVTFKNDALGIYYAALETDLNAGDGFREKGYAAGLGPSMGFIKNITGRWKAHPWARAVYYELGDRHRSFKLSLDQGFSLNRNSSLALSLSGERVFKKDRTEIKLGWNLYF